MTLSILSDFCAIVVMREFFGSFSQSISSIRIAATIFALFSVAMLICGVPMLITIWLERHDRTVRGLSEAGMCQVLTWLNFTTAMLCLIPALMITVAVLHRLLWPTLSRLIYPLSRHRIVSNRKALIAVSSLCVMLAFNLRHVGVEDILNLFH